MRTDSELFSVLTTRRSAPLTPDLAVYRWARNAAKTDPIVVRQFEIVASPALAGAGTSHPLKSINVAVETLLYLAHLKEEFPGLQEQFLAIIPLQFCD